MTQISLLELSNPPAVPSRTIWRRPLWSANSEENLRHLRNLREIMTRIKNSPKKLVVSKKTLIFAGNN